MRTRESQLSPCVLAVVVGFPIILAFVFPQPPSSLINVGTGKLRRRRRRFLDVLIVRCAFEPCLAAATVIAATVIAAAATVIAASVIAAIAATALIVAAAVTMVQSSLMLGHLVIPFSMSCGVIEILSKWTNGRANM